MQRQRRRLRVRNRIKARFDAPAAGRVPQPQARLRPISRRRAWPHAVRGQHGRQGTCPSELKYGGNKTAAQAVGKAIAERALAAGVKDVAFDRRDYQYHGRVAALADAAREAGLNF